MSLVRALEITGNILDDIETESSKLPNEFMKGKVEGVTLVYKALHREIEKPYQERQDVSNEDIPFSTPPQVSQSGQMVKYGEGERLAGIQDMVEVQRMLNNVPQKNETVETYQLQELREIRNVLEQLFLKVADAFDTQEEKVPVSSYSVNAPRWDTTFGDRMRGTEDPTNNAEGDLEFAQKEAILEEEPLVEEKQLLSHEEREALFSDHNFEQEEHEFIDPQTGHRGKRKLIGSRMDVDDDDKMPVEEWQKQKPTLGRPYVARQNDDYGLQDLGPGE